jgi:meromycolic acid (3R)-3-hydroxyacyl-[acyl-carrier protein] dehydratase HadAB
VNSVSENSVQTRAADVPGDPAAHALSMVGHHYRVEDHYEVGREKVREYARAVQDYHPLHWDENAALEHGYNGLLAPLTFISLVGILAQRKLFENVVTGYDLSQIMQTDQVLEFHKPIEAGDKLTCDVYLDSFRQSSGADIIVTKNVVTDQHDNLVQTTYTTLVGRTGTEVDENIAASVHDVVMHGVGAEAPDTVPVGGPKPFAEPKQAPANKPSALVRAFDSVAQGDELPPRIVRLTRGDLVNYGGVSGDANPIHWSDEIAKLAGLDNVVAHGMLTMGLGAGFVTSWAGDPGVVKDYSVRFTSPVKVDPRQAAEVEFTGRIKSVDPESRTAVIAIVAKSAGRKIFGRATATVQLA